MAMLPYLGLTFRYIRKGFIMTNIVRVNNVLFGGDELLVIAGPCAVESYDSYIKTAISVKKSGAKMLRGGAFKARTSPHSFQGLKKEGLDILKEASKETGLPFVTEVLDPRDVELVSSYADMLQIGARNMQNFSLLREVGLSKKPVILKRGFCSTIFEWLNSAEYITDAGNPNVVLCERGIRTFETATRNTLDLSCIPVIKEQSNFPIIVDPSHATGKWQYVTSMSCAAVACGCDGLMIEVHNDPKNALCDGEQSLKPDTFDNLMKITRRYTNARQG